MSTTLVVNGTSYAYPSTGDQSWGDQATLWASAITTGVLQKAGGTFTLTADVNFGSNFGLISKYFKSISSNIAGTGVVRLANLDGIAWRNAANSADLSLTVDNTDTLNFNGSALSVGGVPVQTQLSVSDTSTIHHVLSSNTLSSNIIAGSITDAHISASAAIQLTKLAALTASVVPVTNSSGVLTSSSVSATTLGYLDATSSIQTQLNSKQATGNYITALTGDVSASGPGSVASTVNSVGGSTAANIHTAEQTVNSSQAANKFFAAPNGSAGVPSFRSILAADIPTLNQNTTGTAAGLSSTLAIASGGTGQTTANAAFNALSPMTSVGDLIIGGASGAATRLPIGSTGNVPTVSGGTIVWAPAGTASPLTTKGDLYGFDTGNNRIPVGGNNKIPTADSSSSLGLTYAYPSGKNYVTNPGFESNTTTGWSLGTLNGMSGSIPNGTPTFGSGSSGNLSISTVSSGQLAGSYSLQYLSSSATTAGDMLASSAFTIDKQDQAKVLTFKFYYSPASGTSTANWSGTNVNSFGVAIYDVTNSAWINPAGCFGMTQGSGVGICTGTFQTASNASQYRLVVYNANATSGAITMLFDDFSVGPQTAPIGYAGGDWVAYTPTFTNFGTVSGVSAYSRRVGDSLEIRGTFTSGTTVAATGSISLGYNGVNGNVTTDINKIPTNNGGIYSLVGEAANSASAHSFTIIAQGNDSVLKIGIADLSSGLSPVNGSSFLGNTQIGSFFARVPVQGWSSNVQMSSDTDTRVVAAKYILASSVSSGSAQPINFATQSYDTHAAVTTGSAWKFTAPVTGKYKVSVGAQLSGLQDINVYVNGVFTNITLFTVDTSNLWGNGTDTFALNAGDYLDIRTGGAGSTTVSNTNRTHISIERLSGPAVIAATESVNCAYGLTTTQAVSANAVIKFDTKVKDTHGAYSSSTGLFTCPVSGEYRVSCVFGFNTSGTNAVVVKNGTAFAYLASCPSANFITSGSLSLPCLAGDTLSIVPDGSINAAGVNSGRYQTYLSIERVGQ